MLIQRLPGGLSRSCGHPWWSLEVTYTVTGSPPKVRVALSPSLTPCVTLDLTGHVAAPRGPWRAGRGHLQPGSCGAFSVKLLWGRGEHGSRRCPLVTGPGGLQLRSGSQSELGRWPEQGWQEMLGGVSLAAWQILTSGLLLDLATS